MSIHQNVYAEGLSPEDALLAKTLNKSMFDCVMKGVLKPKNTVTVKTNEASAETLFDSANQYFKGENAVNILYKYGTGNTVEDGNISCKQLFYGYNNEKESNSFSPFPKMGGKFPDTSKTAEMNTFLESLGYTEVKNGSSDVYCATIVYRVTINSVGQDKQTVPICISARNGVITGEDGTSTTVPKIYLQKDNSGDYVQFVTEAMNGPTPGSFGIAINTPQTANSICKVQPAPVLVASGYLNTQLAMPQFNAKDFFRSFIKKVASVDLGTIPINNGSGCENKTLAQAIADDNSANSSNVTVKVDESKSYEATDDLNGARSTKNDEVRTYKNTGSPDLIKIMDFLLPSYSKLDRTSIYETTRSAYNWYHILHDTFSVISVDGNIGCKTEKPKTGAYLPFYRESKTEPGKNELVYCTLDEMTLDSKNGAQIMTDAPLGVVNGVAEDGFHIEQLTARKALEYLNNVDLPAICAADSSFPLCKATPIDCKEDPSKDGCKDLAGDNASEEEDGPNGETAFCMKNAGAFAWIICPLLTMLRDAAMGMFGEFVEPLLRVHESIIERLASNSSESPTYKAWALFRDMGNIVFVIVLLFVIFSQVTGFGIDNYGIKKVLPKLITTAIIVNFSYIICGIFVDLSNLVGDSIRNIFESIEVPGSSLGGSASGSGIAWWVSTLLSVIGLGVAGIGITGIIGSVMGGGIGATLFTVIVPVLTFLGMAALAGFIAMLMLGVRQALVIIMIVISPIAFVLYAIPNTNPFFKKWSQLFRGLLVLYPVFCFMAGGGMLASRIIIATSKEFYLQLVGSLICIAPYFAVPSMTKNALKGFDSAINGLARIQNYGARGIQAANKTTTNSRTYKNAVSDIESGRTARANEKIANRFMKKSPEEIARMPVGRRNRILGSISNATKDAQQSASIGAIASQYRNAISDEGKERTRISSMNAEDDNQVKSYLSGYIDKNMSHEEALRNLATLQSEGYGNNEEENHQRDLQMRAYQRHILSTKDGQKAYEDYLQTGQYKDIDGQIVTGSTSERSRAVLARDYMSNNSDLKDKYGITYRQMQGMQGSGSIAQLKTSTAGPAALQSSRNQATNKFIDTMDSKDIRELSKNDAAEISKARTNGLISTSANDMLETIAQGAVRSLENDPTQIGELNDDTRKLITNASGTNIDNLGNRVMEVRDNNGQLIQTMRWAKNGPANGGGNGGGNGGNGNGGGNGGNGNGGGNGGNGNGGPTP